MRRILLVLISVVTVSFSMVDINHANAKELSSLKGIGLSKAKAIVEYRKMNGCFEDINSLQKVKGIGKSIMKKNQKDLKLIPCKK